MAIDLQTLLGYRTPRQRDFSERIWFVPFNITFRCGLNCEFCYAKGREHEELTTSEIKTHVIDNIANSKARWIGFTGGDPLLRDDIFELMLYAKEKGLDTVLGTNGQLLNEERIKRLADIGATRIGIGISGMDGLYSNVMGGGSFDTVDSMIKLCKDYGFEISLRAVVTKHNYSTYMDLVDYAHKQELYKFCRYNMIYAGNASRAIDIPDQEKNALVMALIRKQEEYPDLKIWLMERPYDAVLLSKMGYELKHDMRHAAKCGATKGLINVAPNGDVYPCPYFYDVLKPIGNLRTDKIKDLAKSTIRINLDEGVTGECTECTHSNVCGGCRYHALKYGGDILGGDPFCPVKTP